MVSRLDRVHSHGMSPEGSTYMTVKSFTGPDNRGLIIEPPLEVVFEGKNAKVAFSQDGFAARYEDDELRQIGEGSSTLGIQRVIGDIAMNGKLEDGAIKPLHPGLVEGEILTQAVLPAAHLAITA